MSNETIIAELKNKLQIVVFSGEKYNEDVVLDESETLAIALEDVKVLLDKARAEGLPSKSKRQLVTTKYKCMHCENELEFDKHSPTGFSHKKNQHYICNHTADKLSFTMAEPMYKVIELPKELGNEVHTMLDEAKAKEAGRQSALAEIDELNERLKIKLQFERAVHQAQVRKLQAACKDAYTPSLFRELEIKIKESFPDCAE